VTDVRCENVRTTLSAIADDEASVEERRDAERHLGDCEACRQYATRLAALDRAVRVRPAEPVPDLVDAVTARARPPRLGRGGWIRPALLWVAVLLVVQSVPALVLGHTAGADTHLSRHLGAFGVALALGLAYAAWKPHRAFGLLPFTTALVVTTVASAVFDLLDGDRRAVAESVHLTELAGLALLWLLAGSPGWHGWPGRHHGARRPRHHASA
jgi:predicted anti-sigma-YlaC factor YlaD